MLLSRLAKPILLFSSSAVPSSRRTADTLRSPRRRTSATSVGLSIGTAGTYQLSAGSALTSPATASISRLIIVLQLPHPVPARVHLPIAATVQLPSPIALTTAALEM